MTFPPNLGPIAPERNPAIEPEFYQPSVFTISALARGIQTTITTSVDHNYVVGQLVRLLIPSFYGSFQLNGQDGYVNSIPAANQVVVGINSTQANAFISSPTYGPTPPQIVAVGDVNTGPINSQGRRNNGTFIQGSFINISPQ